MLSPITCSSSSSVIFFIHLFIFQESLRAIEEFVAEHGPFDGLLGFSQGGAMLGLLCGLQQQGKLPFSFRFAIFASAFRSRSLPHQALYSQKIKLPTLHVYGLQDKVGSPGFIYISSYCTVADRSEDRFQ